MNKILKQILGAALKELYDLNGLDIPEFREGLIAYKAKHSRTSAPPDVIRHRMDITEETLGGGICYRALPRTRRSGKAVLFIHGGGFLAEALALHWLFCRRLAERTGCEIFFPQYPLVPESETEASHEMLTEVYKKVFSEYKPEDITIIGDSAGGTLTLSVSMLARDTGLPLAKELVLISPGFVIGDTTEEEHRRLEEIKKNDFIIGQFPIGKIQVLWQGKLSPDDYRADVTKGSIEGLPRITMFTGTNEIMNIPARRFREKLRQRGTPYYFGERKGALHDYALTKRYTLEFELIASRVLGK